MSYANGLVAALRAAVASKISSAPKTPGRNGKGKKRSKTAALEDAPTLPAPTAAQAPKQPNWGMLDPIRPLVPFADTIDMLFTPQVVITVLAALLIYAWFFRAGGPAATGGPGGAAAHWSAQQRHMAYDEIWRREESELWKWLEQRVAIDRVQQEVNNNNNYKFSPDGEAEAGRVDMRDIKQREVDEAIRVTEERLRVLKGRVGKEREKSARESRDKNGSESGKESLVEEKGI